MDKKGMQKIFFPESVVVCGVSDTPGNLGAEIIRNLNRFEFRGRVYGVGRKAMEIEGIKVYAGLSQVPEAPELAVLLVPAPAIPGFLEACGEKGVRQAVIETGGFSEFGPERKGLEDEIGRIAAKWGMTCMGPNCIGVVNTENGLCLPFVPFGKGEIERGGNAFISQSGGLIHELMRRCRSEHVGLGKLASIGNKLMLDGNDILEFLLDDPSTCAVGIYLEDARNGRRLMDLASATEKPVIVLKANNSPVSRQIASFHTSALLGDEAVVTAAFKQAGIHRVATLSEMVDCFKVFSLPPMRGPNVVALSRSGGQAVMMADEAHRSGFTLPALPRDFFDSIGKEARAHVIRGTNPIDLGDVFNDLFYLEVVERALAAPVVDGAVFFYDFPFDAPLVPEVVKGLERLCRSSGKPAVLCMVPDKADWFALKYAAPFPWFSATESAFAALARSLAQHRKAGLRPETSFASAEERDSGRRPWRLTRNQQGRPVGPPPACAGTRQPPAAGAAGRALSLVEAYGIPVVRYELVADRAAGLAAAKRIGYPVALKVAEPVVLHKTEADAVRLGIGGDSDFEAAFDAMPADLYLVQEMAGEGVEVIIGAKKDPEFGPVIMFGLGGVFVEVMGDVTCRVLPIDEKDTGEMIGEVKGAALLAGFRGAPTADMESLVKACAAVSRLMLDHPEIESLDINPIRVLAKGSGCLALDVKMGVREEGP